MQFSAGRPRLTTVLLRQARRVLRMRDEHQI
jgi:hypothetical protein